MPCLAHSALAALFTLTLFLSAALVFCVQPLIAKRLLPLLGGSPSVWNVCMVFFQAALLGGYAYAHWNAGRSRSGRSLAIHLCLLAGGLLFLPYAVPDFFKNRLPATAPAGWLLACLLVTAGVPFFAVSSTAPLLQRWFSQTSHPAARDPYFLYSASNVGSLLALLAYPLLMEPLLTLPAQEALWAVGYGANLLLIAACGLATLSQRAAATDDRALAENDTAACPARSSASMGRRRLRWVFLAAVPSSLLLGVTSYLGTDIASAPLLWVVPLALYLSTFILVFARRRRAPASGFEKALPVLAMAIVFLLSGRITEPVALLIAVHLLFFFAASMVCHGQLAEDRPPPGRLTEFYFWMSVGGVVGGAFNALAAPFLFDQIIEYPLAIVLAAGLAGARGRFRLRPISFWDAAAPAGLLILVLGLRRFHDAAHPAFVRNLLAAGIPALLCYFLKERPLRFALGLAVLLGAGWLGAQPGGSTLLIHRNFYGVSRVTVSEDGGVRQMFHGNTVHGRQAVDPETQCEPLAYYSADGPLGDVFAPEQNNRRQRIGVIGLGAGALAAWGRAGQQWTFYEIDPAVIEIARNGRYFTYLTECARAPIKIVQGDGRLAVESAPSESFDLIVLDAFSSDAIPTHLLTREAMQLYLSKLAPGGALLAHISNRHLDLEPVFGSLAASLRLAAKSRYHVVAPGAPSARAQSSHWVILAREEADIEWLTANLGWFPLRSGGPGALWTDSFSNIVRVMNWR